MVSSSSGLPISASILAVQRTGGAADGAEPDLDAVGGVAVTPAGDQDKVIEQATRLLRNV